MKRINTKIAYIAGLVIVLVAAIASIWQPHMIGLPLIVLATLLSTLCICLLTVAGVQSLRTRNPKSETFDHGPVAKILGTLLVVALITCVVAATRSLWIEPSHAKFAYENTATIAGLTAVALLVALSALQKDIYWVNGKKAHMLDERQIKERQQVFETSYKLGAFFMLGIAWFSAKTLHNIPAIISIHNNSVPGHLFWLPFFAAITLFALPLVIAAWRK